MGGSRPIRRCSRTRTVREDWSAWLPAGMDQLFGDVCDDLKCSDTILNVVLNESLEQGVQWQWALAAEQAAVFTGLFNRLSARLLAVIHTVEKHSSHFGTLPNVTPLIPANFRGATAQRISRTSNLLSRVVFRARTRFFHKLQALGEIIEDVQEEVRATVEEFAHEVPSFPLSGWQELEVLSYDLSTCIGETTVVLKSFLCVLPEKELETFRHQLSSYDPAPLRLDPGRMKPFQRK
jgi:hypothetical protein